LIYGFEMAFEIALRDFVPRLFFSSDERASHLANPDRGAGLSHACANP
jgi:hypothetical protein